MRAAVLAIALILAGCAHPARPRAPAPSVRAEIEQAENAERARQHDVARVHYQRAVAAAADPESIAYARHAFAETLASWGEVAEAIVQLEAAVAARPGDAAAWNDLGILRHHEGDDVRALVALEHARAASPDDPRPRIALAALRWSTGDRTGAATEYRALLELDLPDRLREKVKWALAELAKPRR